MEFLKVLIRRHPLLRDALLWAIPAILLGAMLRWWLLSYQPYAYWGSDSESFFDFADRVLAKFDFEMKAKRRYMYPLFLLPVALLPGSALQWLAWLQHLGGLLTLVPLAYVARKSFACWRWIIPIVTLAYASLPMIVWYEHELLGEALFFASFIWAMAGWAAWTSQADGQRARRLWWWFFAAFTVLVLTKPSGRFVVPGVLLGLVAVGAWRTLTWKELLPLPVVLGLTLTMGMDKQSSWLLYSSSFPLTRLETPLHADYKAEIRDLVTEARAKVSSYSYFDEVPKMFLKFPEKHPDYPLVSALGAKDKLRAQIYRDLAMEGIRARPDLFLYISAQRVVQSSRLQEFKLNRYDSDYLTRRLGVHYEEMAAERRSFPEQLFGFSKGQPLPAYEELGPKLGIQGTQAEVRLKAYLQWIQDLLALVAKHGTITGSEGTISAHHLAPCGWLFLAGSLLAVLHPYRRNVGLWLFVAAGYLFGVFLVGSANPRFFALAWPPIILASAIPLDLLLGLLSGQLRKR